MSRGKAIKFDEVLLESRDFCNLDDKDLKNKFGSLKNNLDESIQDVVQILIESIKRVYSHEFNKNDLELLNNFLQNVSTDDSNEKSFFAFLIYTIIKNLLNEHVHCLFVNDFSAKNFFLKAVRLYDFLSIGASYNSNQNKDTNTKNKIFSNGIIFSNWKNIIYEHILNLNADKLQNRTNLRFDNVFIFDIDRIVYDYEKFIFDVPLDLTIDEIPIKNFFKLYTDIVGVSSSLIFEKNKLKFPIKLNDETGFSNIIEKIKNSKEKFFGNSEHKILFLAKEIEKLYNQKETVIVDIDNINELEKLVQHLNSKRIKFQVLSEHTNSQENWLLEILTPNKITISTHLSIANVPLKIGGDWEEIALRNTWQVNNDINSNFYKEKLKKEFIIQKEVADKNIEIINQKGGINVIFASHYSELKNEYIIIKNCAHEIIKSIQFFNCPQDEPFIDFRLSNLKLFKMKQTPKTENLFNILAKFLFYMKKFSINKIFVPQNGYVPYSIDNMQYKENKIETPKIGRNDPCPCGSGKKYKNCCGKQR